MHKIFVVTRRLVPFQTALARTRWLGLFPRIKDRFMFYFPHTAVHRHLFTPERRPLLEGYRRGRILTVTAG